MQTYIPATLSMLIYLRSFGDQGCAQIAKDAVGKDEKGNANAQKALVDVLTATALDMFKVNADDLCPYGVLASTAWTCLDDAKDAGVTHGNVIVAVVSQKTRIEGSVDAVTSTMIDMADHQYIVRIDRYKIGSIETSL